MKQDGNKPWDTAYLAAVLLTLRVTILIQPLLYIKRTDMYKSVGALFSFIENCEGPRGLIDRKELFLVSEKNYYNTVDCSSVLSQV